MAELEALGIMVFEVPSRPSVSPPPDIQTTTPSTTETSNTPKTATTTSSNILKATTATTALKQRPTIHAPATTSKALKAQTSPKTPETQDSPDMQPARAASLQSAPAPMEGVDPPVNQPSSALEGTASASRRSNTPLQRTPSPGLSPPPTPPPHSLFSIPLSPLLQRSPPPSPSRNSQQGDQTRPPQKRSAATDESGEDLVDIAAVRPTKKSKGKGAQTPSLLQAITPLLSDRPRRTRASGANQTSSTASQLGATSTAAMPPASTSPDPSTTVKPAWFTSAVSMMRNKELGAQWIQLVNT